MSKGQPSDAARVHRRKRSGDAGGVAITISGCGGDNGSPSAPSSGTDQDRTVALERRPSPTQVR
jgi:hypothetical protein